MKTIQEEQEKEEDQLEVSMAKDAVMKTFGFDYLRVMEMVLDGLNGQEIADVLNVSRQAVWKKISRMTEYLNKRNNYNAE